MPRTCQSILDRALDKSTANKLGLVSAPVEILTRIDAAQQRLFTRLAQENRYFYVEETTEDSTNDSSDRTLDLGALDPPVERLLVAKLVDGRELSQVDLQDLEAELAPRFYPMGTMMVEVGTDWGAGGVVAIQLWYAYRPDALTLTGALTQEVTVPDRFAEWLEYDLAAYFAGKDFGRVQADPTELERLKAEQQSVFEDYVQFLDHFPGPSARRFVLPVPMVGEKA